jgi:hypothetical protein
VGHTFRAFKLFYMNLIGKHFCLILRSVPAVACEDYVERRALTLDTGVLTNHSAIPYLV